jgi:hypothetical protein
VNAEAIFNVCEDHVGELKDTVDSIVRDLASISSI